MVGLLFLLLVDIDELVKLRKLQCFGYAAPVRTPGESLIFTIDVLPRQLN